MIVKFCQNQKWAIIAHFLLNLSNWPRNLIVLSFPNPQILEVFSSKLRRGYVVAFSRTLWLLAYLKASTAAISSIIQLSLIFSFLALRGKT